MLKYSYSSQRIKNSLAERFAMEEIGGHVAAHDPSYFHPRPRFLKSLHRMLWDVGVILQDALKPM